MKAVYVNGLSKEFNDFIALEDISFELDQNDGLLILGPNGAGKTTLFRCILGLLSFDGEIKIFGNDVFNEETKKLLGYVPQIIHLPGNMTAREILRLHAKIHDVDFDEDELLSKFGLEEFIDTPIKKYSGGMRQRLALALAISHDPKILIFDEPLANLDYEGRHIFTDLVREMTEEGKTILVSSHKILDILIYMNKALIIHEGNELYFGPLNKLFDKLGITRFYIKLTGGSNKVKLSKADVIGYSRDWIVLETRDIVGSVTELAKSGYEVGSIFIEEPSLDEIIIKLYKGGESY